MIVSRSGLFFFFKQKTAYEMRISDWSSDVCSSDLEAILTHSKSYFPVDLPEQPWPDDALSWPLHRAYCWYLWLRADFEDLAVYTYRQLTGRQKIGRASCRERVCQYV